MNNTGNSGKTKILVFGGASEGRLMAAALSEAGYDATLSVATEYGRETADDIGATVIVGRLGEDEMAEFIRRNRYECVIDATHPYAAEARRNIAGACRAAGVRRFRLSRPETGRRLKARYAPDAAAAADMLKDYDGKILLTIGSKELEPFTSINGYKEKVYVRILPMADSLEKAHRLGFRSANIICMQGPFDVEMNVATLKMTGARSLVTKSSGDAGGLDSKIAAAESLGCDVIVIARPEIEEDGYTLDEMMRLFSIDAKHFERFENGAAFFPETEAAFFPLFVGLRNRRILMIGGGNIAERRVRTLLSFGADLTVITPATSEYISEAAHGGRLRLISRKYAIGDVADIKPFFVVAATNDRTANGEAAKEACGLGIPISVADCRGDCTCYFPGIAQNESYIAGIVSKTGDHRGVKHMAKKIAELINSRVTM